MPNYNDCHVIKHLKHKFKDIGNCDSDLKLIQIVIEVIYKKKLYKT